VEYPLRVRLKLPAEREDELRLAPLLQRPREPHRQRIAEKPIRMSTELLSVPVATAAGSGWPVSGSVMSAPVLSSCLSPSARTAARPKAVRTSVKPLWKPTEIAGESDGRVTPDPIRNGSSSNESG